MMMLLPELSLFCVWSHPYFALDNCFPYFDAFHEPAIYLWFTALVFIYKFR